MSKARFLVLSALVFYAPALPLRAVLADQIKPNQDSSAVVSDEEPPSTSEEVVLVTPPHLAQISIGKSLDDEKPSPSPSPVYTPAATQRPQPNPLPSLALPLSGIREVAASLCQSVFGPGQFDYLDKIITAESGWRVNAEEPSTHAFGLGQALPAAKMAPYGSDYLTNPETQLKWLMSYIKGRYGTPQQAWQFHLSHHYY